MENTDLSKIVERVIIKLLEIAAIELPVGIEIALREALKKEDTSIARAQLESMLKNIEFARHKGIPLCQDTGSPMFHITLGEDFPIKSEYSLTPKGDDFIGIIKNMKKWALKWKLKNEHCETVNCKYCEL